MEKQRILISIDALIDTRLATVALLSQEAAVGLLGDHYYHREHDSFNVLTNGLVDDEAYRAAYAARDVDTLRAGQVTQLMFLFSRIIASIQTQANSTPEVEHAEVFVNFYPYILDAEQIELYLTCIQAYSGMETQLHAVHYPPSELTPVKIVKNWEAVILYDLDEWLALHQDALIKKPIPRNTVIAPARSATGPIDYAKVAEIGLDEHPFATAERTWTPYVSLDMIEPKYFAVAPPLGHKSAAPA